MQNNNQHIEYEVLIARFLAGEAAQEETRQLNAWREENPANEALFNEYRKSWNLFNTAQQYRDLNINIDAEWKKMQSAMEGDRQNREVKMETPSVRKRLFKITRYAAAIILGLFIGFGTYYLISQSGYEKLAANKEIKESRLPDGTLVTLNTNSSIKYPKKFVKKSREVELNGEAYFTVVKNTGKPFIIDAGEVNVKVLGTAFYVETKEKEDIIRVIVHTGKVAVYTKDKTGKTILNPGQTALYSKKNNTLTAMQNPDKNYLSWKTKRLVFKNTRLQKVVKTLNKTYQANIVIQSNEIKDCRYTNQFENRTLDEILHVLEYQFDLQIKKEKQEIRISGEGCK